jgi:hypothetical protein
VNNIKDLIKTTGKKNIIDFILWWENFFIIFLKLYKKIILKLFFLYKMFDKKKLFYNI